MPIAKLLFAVFIAFGIVLLIFIAYKQYYRWRVRVSTFDPEGLGFSIAFASGVLFMILVGVIWLSFFMRPINDQFAIAMGVSLFVGMVIPLIHDMIQHR